MLPLPAVRPLPTVPAMRDLRHEASYRAPNDVVR
jgi:hypothetical protein